MGKRREMGGKGKYTKRLNNSYLPPSLLPFISLYALCSFSAGAFTITGFVRPSGNAPVGKPNVLP